MRFCDLTIGQNFSFKFDREGWKYQRNGFDRILCINAPPTYSKSVGSIHPWNDPNQEVIPCQNTVFVVSCFERTGAAVSHEQLAEIVIFSTKEKALEFAQKDTKYDYTEINELLVR